MRNLIPLLLIVSACANADGSSDALTGAGELRCEEPADLTCLDELILRLGMHGDRVSEGVVTSVDHGDYFESTVDARAGGFGQSDNNPWLYVRFTEQGLEKVEIDDETALEDMTWHLAAKRFILRLNGGTSGPSCVGAAPVLERDFEDLTQVPDGVRFFQDDFMLEDCTIINDSSGLPDSPQVALSAWWSYPGCVATSGVPFLIQLEDGRTVRLVVDRYYAQGQETCNVHNNPGRDGALLGWRWSFLP
ncbi:MAG: hypothetical protein EA397_04490 [Deltaproteobacteria bacterium]|nr:MAG: hypothetical protein EA397_04490 [Deltaproteobacteria bacterium]